VTVETDAEMNTQNFEFDKSPPTRQIVPRQITAKPSKQIKTTRFADK